MKIIKGEMVKSVDETRPNIKAFQLCTFVIDYFGNTMEITHDTIITQDGKQYVVDGCGFVPQGFEIPQQEEEVKEK